MKAKAGRKSKLTEEVIKSIAETLEAGNFRSVAAKAAGISLRTFTLWFGIGKKKHKSKFRRFYRAVIDAESRAEIRAVRLLMAAAENDPKHAAWWLAHRHNARWADKTRVRAEHTGKHGGPIEVTDARSRLAEKLAALLEARRADADSETPH